MLAFATSCTTPHWNRVQPGMDRQTVLSLLGEPTKRDHGDVTKQGFAETWRYDHYDLQHAQKKVRFEPHRVEFQDGHVTSVAFDRERFDEIRRAEEQKRAREKQARTVPADVGTRCFDDSQCASKKCTFGKCAGPGGCTGLVGAECSSNIDCCSGTCNMASMKCL